MPGRAKRLRAWSVGFNISVDGPASTLDAVTAVNLAAFQVRTSGYACELSHIQANEKHPGYGRRFDAMLPGDLILPGQPLEPMPSTVGVMAAAEAQAAMGIDTEVAPSYGVTFTLSIRDPDVFGAGDAVQQARRIIDRLADAGVTCHVLNVNATRESPDIMEIYPEVARAIGRAMNKGVGGEDWKDDDDPEEGPAD